ADSVSTAPAAPDPSPLSLRDALPISYSVDSTALAEGTYTARASQSDAAGNTGTSTDNTFVVDTTAPVVSLVTPANGSSTNDTTRTDNDTAEIHSRDNPVGLLRLYDDT